MSRRTETEQRTPRYARAARIAEILGVNQITVWRWSRSGRIPRPRKIGPSVTVWNLDDVLAALERAAAEHDAEAS